MKKINICCIGAGYVGGPTMAVIALKCPEVNITVVDSNPQKIDEWNGELNNLPIFEPGLAEIISLVRNKNLFFSKDIKGAIEKSEIIFMAVNTPTVKKGNGAGMAADLSYIINCAHDIAKYSNSDKIVIEKSTVPIRTAEKIKEILDQNTKGLHFEVLSNPEFLSEGTAINDMLNPSRILIGGDKSETGQNATNELVKIYSSWVPSEKILKTNVWSSELAKLASNAMLAQRISSINSLSALCEKSGANIDELSDAIGMDYRIGPYFLKASVGFGGSCFQKDILNLVYLCRFYGLEEVANYWLGVVKINDYQKERFANKIIEHFGGDLTGKNIAVLGWAFKSNTNDSRESASIFVSKLLFEAGANLVIYDPKVELNTIWNDINNIWNIKTKKEKDKIKIISELKFEDSIDALAILTEWKDFKNIDIKKYKIFDGRGIIKNSFYSVGK